jgi:hypothetical protein
MTGPNLTALQSRKDALDSYMSGVQFSTDRSSSSAQSIANLFNNFRSWQMLNKDFATYIQNKTPQNISTTLSDIGTKQQQISTLKTEIKQAKSDSEVAEQRDTQIKLSPPETSNYQGLSTFFGITRPLKFISVPILFGISVFLLIVSILLLKENFLLGTGYSFGTPPSISTDVSILKDPRIWGTLFGASVIIILFMSLKIAGKLPVLPA